MIPNVVPEMIVSQLVMINDNNNYKNTSWVKRNNTMCIDEMNNDGRHRPKQHTYIGQGLSMNVFKNVQKRNPVTRVKRGTPQKANVATQTPQHPNV